MSYLQKRTTFVITKTKYMGRKRNNIDRSLNDIAKGRVYTAKDIDDLMDHLAKSTNDLALIKRIKEAEKEISNGKTTKVKNINNIWESIIP